ncbi:OsmC family peroxiredoxin [Haloplanus sp. GCM10025708]
MGRNAQGRERPPRPRERRLGGAVHVRLPIRGGDETNPEELIGAAEAGCFSMALALGLEEAGYAPERIHTEASVHLDADALEIDRIDLRVEGEVPDADADAFREQAAEAKENCPVSKALAGPAIDLTAELL